MGHYRMDAENLILQEILVRTELLSLFDGIINVVNEFDGKVINKRFEEALKDKVSKSLWAHKNSYGMFELVYYVPNDSVMSTDGQRTYYIQTRMIYIFRREPEVLFPNRRVSSDHLVPMLETKRKELDKEVKDLDKSLLKMDEWIYTQRKLVNELQDLRSSIPYLVKQYVQELKVPSLY